MYLVLKRQLDQLGDLHRPTVTPAHHQVTNVHDNCIFQGRHIDKFTWFSRVLNLEPVSYQENNPDKAFDLPEDPRSHLGKPW